jgi:hypothetical protein
MFETQQIKGDYYGVAVAVANMLLKRNPSKFREFIIAIKDGHAPDEALNLSYEMTYADVARTFGRRIGPPHSGHEVPACSCGRSRSPGLKGEFQQSPISIPDRDESAVLEIPMPVVLAD